MAAITSSTSTGAAAASSSRSIFHSRMPDALRLIVVDDEDLARKLVRRYARKITGVEVIAECRDTAELVRALESHDADVILLDIRMPGPDVFSILESRREALPLIIFATAYDE